MLMIRLQRVGRTNDPSFRVVVTEKTNGPQSGSFIEIVGSYDARKDRVNLKTERIKHWLSVGAKTSGTVHNLLVDAKIITGPKVDVSPSVKKKPSDSASNGTQGKESVEQPKRKEVKSEEKPSDAKTMEGKKEEIKETPTEESKEEVKKEDL